MKELAVQVRIKNNRLLQRRRELELSQADLATMIGISLHTYQELESIKRPPTTKVIPRSGCVIDGCAGKAIASTAWLCLAHKGHLTKKEARAKRREIVARAPEEWTSSVLKMADFFEVEPEELFPDAVLNLRKSKDERLIDADELGDMLARQLPPPPPPPTPQDLLEAKELSLQVQRLLEALSAREKFVISCRFGLLGVAPMTLAEIGSCYKTSGDRVRVIEGEALRKLRHPSVNRKLREMLEDSISSSHIDNEPAGS